MLIYEPGPETAGLAPFHPGDKLIFLPIAGDDVKAPRRPRGPYTLLGYSPTGIPRLRGPRGSTVYRGPGGYWWPGRIERL